jgi:hypothetical protein
MGDQPSWPVVMMTTLHLWFERRGVRIRRRGLVGLSVLLICGLGAALAAVLIVSPGATSASVRPAPSAKPSRQPDPAALRAEAVLRGQAAAWVAQQVSPAAIVSCDPAMCSALQADGVPSSQLLVLVLADADPLGSEVVVATSAVRSQFGARRLGGL